MSEEEGELISPWRARLLRARVIVPLLCAPIAIWLLAKTPRWLLDRAHERAIDCTNHIYETGDGDPTACRSWSLAIARWAPWTSDDADRESAEIEAQVAEDQMQLAVDRDVDAAALDRATHRYFDVMYGKPLPDDHNAAAVAISYGAWREAETVTTRPGAEFWDVDAALETALLHGDGEAARVATAVSPVIPGDAYTEAYERRRGIAQCLDGDTKGAVESFARSPNDPDSSRWFAAIACGGTAPNLDPTWLEVASCVARMAGGEGTCESKYDAQAQLRYLAEQARGQTDLSDLLDTITKSGEGLWPTRTLLDRWTLLDHAVEDRWPSQPAAWRDAAARLLALAAKANPIKPADNIGDLDDDVIAHPAVALRHGAWSLDVAAAIAFGRRGQLADARAAATEALALARQDQDLHELVVLPGVLDLADDPQALALADEVLAALPADDTAGHAFILIGKAMMLARAGRFDDARAALAGADGKDGVVAWLGAALALRTGHAADVARPAPAAEIGMDDIANTLDWWWAAATGTDAQRRDLRWRAHGERGLIGYELAAVMPAMMYVIGAAAGDGDRELWLDRMFASPIMDPRLYLASRAEAARWAGDATAAAAWDQRVADYEALGKDDRGAYLLDLLAAP